VDKLPLLIHGTESIRDGIEDCSFSLTGGCGFAVRQQDPGHFFNLAAFVNRLPGAAQFRYGNSGRKTVIGPGIIDWDFSVLKRFRFSERSNLEFRGEFFNIPNHPIFANPGLSVGTLSYGLIGARVVDSRQIQFGLRLAF